MGDFVEDFVHLLTDPAHLALEFMFVLLDVLVIQAVANKIKKHFHKDIADEHAKIEAEHGLVHPLTHPTLSDHYLVDGQWVHIPVQQPRAYSPDLNEAAQLFLGPGLMPTYEPQQSTPVRNHDKDSIR